MFRITVISLVLLLLAGCKSKENTTGEAVFPNWNERFSPTETVVSATVLSLGMDSIYQGDSTQPCGVYPCIGRVRIDSVLQVGSHYPQNLRGKVKRIRFIYSAGPTSEFFSALKPALPGLSKGHAFIAGLSQQPNNDFTVKEYIRLN
jgi:hypothetical protein